jgi:signal transduction histidine kinase
MKKTTIKIRTKNKNKEVKLGKSIKHGMHNNIIDHWQSLIDTAARILGVPSGAIMQLNKDYIEIFLTNNNSKNPLKTGEIPINLYGTYCENVIGTQEKLIVPNIEKSNLWKVNNPATGFNFKSYLGYPINWPNGKVFGTICMFDYKENYYNKDFQDLLELIKHHIENDLNQIQLNKDLKEKNKELSNLNEELKKLNNTKSRFLSLISHDIRGSIATINEFIKLILSGFDNFTPEELKSILVSLSKDTASSYETLEDLLSWSKSDIIALEPNIQPVNLIEIIEKILVYFEKSISMKNLKISKVFCTPEITIFADKDMITVVLRNLISNAIKFSKKNSEIEIRACYRKNKYQITIQDEGVGMSEETLSLLFTYDKDHGKGATGQTSAGIGLILVKEFLDKMEAQIEVKSKLNVGSSFTITI